jgi:hypothetical protein
METPERGALMLVRFTAVALIGWSLVELALYVAISQHKSTPITFLPCLIRSLPLLAGLAMLVKARAIAQWVADKLDL